MIADQATPATVIANMIVTISEIFLHASGSLRIDVGKPFDPLVRVCRHLPLSSFDPPGLPISARIFLGQRSDRIALPLGKCRAGRVPLFSRCSLRVSGTLWDASHLPDFSLLAVSSIVGSHSENHHGSSIKIRNHPIRPRYLSRCQVAV
jgi:hypothetical protein